MFHRPTATTTTTNNTYGSRQPIYQDENHGHRFESKPIVHSRRYALGDISNTDRTNARPRQVESTTIYTRSSVHSATAAAASVPASSSNFRTTTSSTARLSLPSSPPVDIDRHDRDDPQAVTEYLQDIFDHFHVKEVQCQINANYLSSQPDIAEKMRGILVDWLVDVHLKYRLQPETLFLCIQLVDRYLACKPVSRSKLQLVGVTAMLIACKYEEIYSPDIGDFVKISDNSYTRDEIMRCEIQMLNALEFNLGAPTSFQFVRRFAKAGSCDASTSHTAEFLCELSLNDYSMLKYLPSQIAAASVYLARKMNSISHADWTSTLQYYSKYSESAIHSCVEDMKTMHTRFQSGALKAIFRKYSSSKYMEVSKIRLA